MFRCSIVCYRFVVFICVRDVYFCNIYRHKYGGASEILKSYIIFSVSVHMWQNIECIFLNSVNIFKYLKFYHMYSTCYTLNTHFYFYKIFKYFWSLNTVIISNLQILFGGWMINFWGWMINLCWRFLHNLIINQTKSVLELVLWFNKLFFEIYFLFSKKQGKFWGKTHHIIRGINGLLYQPIT